MGRLSSWPIPLGGFNAFLLNPEILTIVSPQYREFPISQCPGKMDFILSSSKYHVYPGTGVPSSWHLREMPIKLRIRPFPLQLEKFGSNKIFSEKP